MSKASLLKRIDDLLGPLLCRVFARPQTAVDYPALDDISGPILVIRPGGIGDAVLLLPMLAALRSAFPARRIDLLCETRNRAVVAMAHPDVRLLLYDAHPFAALRRLRAARYAAVLDTEQFHHFSGVLAAWTRAPLRVGFKINTKRNALYTHLVSYDLDGPEEAQFARLLAALSGRVPTLPPKEGILADAPLRASPAGVVPSGTAFALVHAGGSVACKRWPAIRYAQLCDRLEAECGLQPVLVGGRDDRAFARAVRAACRKPPQDTTGRLSLAQVAGISRTAAVFVGPDSGIAHLATAVGARCVVLFGPSDPAKWGPAHNGAVVRHPVPCGPCAIFGYNKPCRTYACMERIAVEDVVAAVRAVAAPARAWDRGASASLADAGRNAV